MPERTCTRCGARPVAPGRYTTLCGECCYRAKRTRGRTIWHWTPEALAYLREHYDPLVPGRAEQIAQHLGFPTWAVKRRATLVGLARRPDWRVWAPSEVAFLVDHAGRRSVEWMAGRLGRTASSVALKIKRLNISRSHPGVYSARRAATAFGVESHAVIRWVSAGLLQAHRRHDIARARSPWVLEERDLVEFALSHPEAYDLGKVDHEWLVVALRAYITGRPQVCSACDREIIGQPVFDLRPTGEGGRIERHPLCVDCAEVLGGGLRAQQ